MNDPAPWVAIGVSTLALLVSVLALVVNYEGQRAAGARLSVTQHEIGSEGGEDWLVVRVANSGRADVNIEGAWTNLLDGTTTQMPLRLAGISSAALIFRGVLPPTEYYGALQVTIGFMGGRTISKTIRLTDWEQGQLRLSRAAAMGHH